MKLTLSVIKADIGSIGGHVAPSRRLQETVKAFIRERHPGRTRSARRYMYLAFADVMNTPGLILSPKMSKGFRFVIGSPSGPVRVVSRPWPSPHRACTTSPASTPAKMIR